MSKTSQRTKEELKRIAEKALELKAYDPEIKWKDIATRLGFEGLTESRERKLADTIRKYKRGEFND